MNVADGQAAAISNRPTTGLHVGDALAMDGVPLCVQPKKMLQPSKANTKLICRLTVLQSLDDQYKFPYRYV